MPGLAIRATASAGVHPRLPGLGPVPAVESVLAAAGLRWPDVGAVEVTEAFASQVLACTDAWGLDPLGADGDARVRAGRGDRPRPPVGGQWRPAGGAAAQPDGAPGRAAVRGGRVRGRRRSGRGAAGGAGRMIRLEGVSHSFGEQPVLRDVDLELTEQRIAVVGANGSGKSTLARLLNGLVLPTSGRVTVDGLDTRRDGAAVRRRVGFRVHRPGRPDRDAHRRGGRRVLVAPAQGPRRRRSGGQLVEDAAAAVRPGRAGRPARRTCCPAGRSSCWRWPP